MTDSKANIERGVIIELLYSLNPPSIRNGLLRHKDFVDRFDLQVKHWLTLPGTSSSVLKPQLHKIAIELFERPDAKLVLNDKSSIPWTASLDGKNLGVVLLESGKKVIRLPSLWMLMPKPSDRLTELERVAEINGLSYTKLIAWKKVLRKRCAKDNEVDLLFQDLKDSITSIEKNIEEEFGKEEGVVRDFVPIQTGYYENLIGKLTEGNDANTFLQEDYKDFIDDYAHLPPVRRISIALLSCWHSKSAKAISVIDCEFDELVGLIEHTVKRDNACAIAGLAEVCLYKLENEPRLAHHIGKLLEPLISSEFTGHSLKLLSSMCMFIDAELATSKSFQSGPPFYRRLAAFSHACLLERVFRNLYMDSPDYLEWCKDMSGEFKKRNGTRYYFQNLCDLREEPHWLPEYVSPESLKREFLGRLTGTAEQVKEFLPEGELRSKLLEDVDGGLRKHLKSVLSFVPGPLEGAGNDDQLLPQDIKQMAITQLGKEPVDANSFIVIVNLANGLRPDTELAELAATKFQDAQFYLKGFKDEEALWGVIGGMALLAAKTRCHKLAKALKRFVSRMLYFESMSIDIQQLVRYGLITAAAFDDVRRWSDFLDEWFSPIAFGEMTKSQASEMHYLLKIIIRYVPMSNAKLAPTLTALEAYQKS